jgi:hypothetical protein
MSKLAPGAKYSLTSLMVFSVVLSEKAIVVLANWGRSYLLLHLSPKLPGWIRCVSLVPLPGLSASVEGRGTSFSLCPKALLPPSNSI